MTPSIKQNGKTIQIFLGMRRGPSCTTTLNCVFLSSTDTSGWNGTQHDELHQGNMFHPSKACQLAFCQQPEQLASQVGNHTTSCIPFLQISQAIVPSTMRKSKPFSMRYHTIVGAAPKYRDETDAKGVMHNHNLKLQQWHSSDFFAEAWAKCFNKQDENGHSRFDPVHFQMIQYETFSSDQQC